MIDLTSRRVGVSLTSGFFGFYAHCGFVTALEDMGARPLAIAGTSAGALTGGLWAAGLDASAIRESLLGVRLPDMIDLPVPWEMISAPGGLVRGRRMERSVASVLPVQRFEECRIPLHVGVFDIDDGKPRIIETGSIARAVRASASMPFMFGPTRLHGHWCWDGGTVEKMPLAPLVEREDLDTILVCYLAETHRPGRPRTIAAGLRAALKSLQRPAERLAVEEARRKGKDVLVACPRVSRCGPHLLRRGDAIIWEAHRETHRIFEDEDFGLPP